MSNKDILSRILKRPYQEILDQLSKDKQFLNCIPFIHEREGGYVNHPADPGGETNYGISKRAFPELDIKALTKEEANVIYYQRYWLFIADTYSWPLNLCIFDCAVNQGTKRARQFLKETLDWRKYIELRRAHYISIVDARPSSKVFLKGWMNRLIELRKYIEEKGA